MWVMYEGRVPRAKESVRGTREVLSGWWAADKQRQNQTYEDKNHYEYQN
jgi:hypothetical protein